MCVVLLLHCINLTDVMRDMTRDADIHQLCQQYSNSSKFPLHMISYHQVYIQIDSVMIHFTETSVSFVHLLHRIYMVQSQHGLIIHTRIDLENGGCTLYL